MLKIKIGGTEIPYLNALEKQEFFDGNRRVLTVTCAPDAIGVDALNALLTEENLQQVVLTNTDEEITNIYEGYVLKLSCGIQLEMAEPETPESPSVYEDHLIFKLGRRTYLEQALRALGL